MIIIKPRVFPDLINSFRFYIMLGIHLSSRDNPEKISTESFREFLKDLRNSNKYSDEVINHNLLKAYQSLKTEFLSLYNFEINPDDRLIKIIE